MSSFGDKLKRERELRGISLREIADGTKISVRFLQALEEDRIEALPGGLFPRAFVKQYALFLGLDAERSVAEFAEAHGESVPERRTVAPIQASRQRSLPVGHIFLGVIAVAAVALTLGRRGTEAPPAPSPTPQSAPVVLPTDRVYPSPTRAGVASDSHSR